MSTSDPLSPPPLSRWRWGVCLLLMLATVINYMDRMALNQMALRIKTYFGMNNTEYSWLESVFSFAFAIGAITTGYIVDKISVRWVYPVMVLGWSIAGVLTGFATGFWMLLSCRFALGFFEAGNWPCGIRTTKAILRPEERSLGNSLFQSGTALGAVLTPLVVLALIYSIDPEEPKRNAIMSVTGGTYAAVVDAPLDTWKFPFRVIGSLGVVWIVLWFLLVPRAMLRAAERSAADPAAPRPRFAAVFQDRRFWVLLTLSITINVSWHGYRTWLPLYLQEERHYSELAMSKFTTLYYLVADVGSWTIGGLTLWMSSRGLGIHRSRIIALGLCATLTLLSVSVPFLPNGVALQAVLLAIAFGGLGLFPTYFALSQEVSVEHQGKVTGVLGASAHFSLAAIYPIEGMIADATGSKALVLGIVGTAPIVGLIVLLWHWSPKREAEREARTSA
jgi:ACS family hexuronate transporter-like MFS transporter